MCASKEVSLTNHAIFKALYVSFCQNGGKKEELVCAGESEVGVTLGIKNCFHSTARKLNLIHVL